MIYRTKVDPLTPIALIRLIGLPIAIGLIILIGAGAPVGWFVLIVGPAPLLLVLLLVGWPVDYDPDATRSDGEPILLVRCGRLLRYEIPLAGISEVRPSASPLSSPASWSYDRLEIAYRLRSGFGRTLLISPRDRDGFLGELARRAGYLERQGDRLLQRHGTKAVP
jgi:hypothetical protein